MWRDVVGYEDLFSVSNTGDIFSKRTGRVLKKNLNPNGYYYIYTKIGGRLGKNKALKVSRTVAQAFHPDEYSSELQVNHIDGDKTNDSATNLEWVTRSENIRHAISTGLLNHDHNKKYLSNAELTYITKNFKSGCRKFGVRAISRDLGYSREYITNQLINLGVM